MTEQYVGERKRPELDTLDWLLDKLQSYDRQTVELLVDYLRHWNKVRSIAAGLPTDVK